MRNVARRDFGVSDWWEQRFSHWADGIMCAMMNRLQWRLRHLACSEEELEAYLAEGESMTREEFFAVDFPADARWERSGVLAWPSPQLSGYPENDVARAEVFWAPGPRSAPVVFLLHALMSASGRGYRRLARQFNRQGWHAVFFHLPYHYSRKPSGQPNGALAITANLVRNGEGLRQAVREVRQMRAWLWQQGVREFALLGTSYGGWVGALTSFLEENWKFLALVQPIANVDRAIWGNPAAASIRRILQRRGIGQEAARRHQHLSSPLHGVPLMNLDRAIICAGAWDRVSPPEDLDALVLRWGGGEVLHVRQGHFGYRALPRTLAAAGRWVAGA